VADLWLGLFLIALALLAWCGGRLRHLMRDRELAARACAAAVADRVAMRQQTAEAQAHLNGLGAAGPDALLLLDADRRILWGNPNAWTLFGCDTPPVGQPFIVLAGDAELNQAVQDALAGGRSVVRQAGVHNSASRCPGRSLSVL